MAKIYEFPKQLRLPQELEECLYGIADAYMKTLNCAMMVLGSDNPTPAELSEIQDLVVSVYAKGLCEAINNIEEG